MTHSDALSGNVSGDVGVKCPLVTGSHLWRMKYLRTRKNLLLNFKPVTRIWKKNVQLTKSWKTIKTNCPKFFDIQWNKRRNRVGWLHFVYDVTLFCRSFTIVRLVCFVSHSNDMTSWLSSLADNVSCNVVTSCLLWRHRWMRFYTKFINRILAVEGVVWKA
jgi:hypothetical protein